MGGIANCCYDWWCVSPPSFGTPSKKAAGFPLKLPPLMYICKEDGTKYGGGGGGGPIVWPAVKELDGPSSD